MGNKKKSKRKSGENSSKKIVLFSAIILGAVVIISGATFGIIKITKYYKAKTIQIGYIGLPSDITNSLSDEISKNTSSELKFTNLEAANLDSKSLKKKYDLIITWDGQLVDSLVQISQPINKKCYSLQPNSLHPLSETKMFVQLSNYEMAYNKKKTALIQDEYPGTLAEFENFLNNIRDYVFCPFICEGSDDQILVSFISCLIESDVGIDGYNSFIEKIRSGASFAQLLDFKIHAAKDDYITLRDILDELKTWPEKGYTHPSWYVVNKNDIETFMESDQVGAVFTSLEKHRAMRYRDIEKFESCSFPIASVRENHGKIMPAVTCIKINSTADIDDILVKLLSVDVQEQLSFKTMFAPASSRGQAYDRQSDDIRFWAASCKEGPIPDIMNAAFQFEPEKGKDFAKRIRDYLGEK